jgi:hypothetical protein
LIPGAAFVLHSSRQSTIKPRAYLQPKERWYSGLFLYKIVI